MATTPELHEPQIAAARAQAWHQAGDPLLTLEAARGFVQEHGFVLFAPRPLGAPAPSLVEATLGSAKASTTAADAQVARSLVARLTAEGHAVPLNLLGGQGDLPDFVVSTQAFPFVFTLRGDKGWKRPPETSGAVKVTPLGLRVYELISERGAMTVAEMVSEAGREVTESAVLRGLTELWSMLRVIPALQQGEGDTLWELTTARFVKAVKAGANAGQPTALSALISLYLGQALVASEEEIAGFLSPLTARSRVRDVLHGLVAGRQLSEGVVEGKSVLYIPDALPDFAQFATEEEPAETEATDEAAGTEVEGEEGTGERIRRFGAGPGASRDKNLRGKPAAREGGLRPAAKRASSGERRPREAGADRPKRSFGDRGDRGDRGGSGAERRGPRPERSGPRPERSGPRPERSGEGFPRRERSERPARAEGFERRPRAEGAERRPRAEGDRPARPSYTRPWDENRPARPRREGEGTGRPERRAGGDRPPRREGAGREGRPFRGERPGGGSRPPRREGAGEARPFRADRPAGSRPPRREGAADRPFRPSGEGGDRERRPFQRRELPPELHESGHAERGQNRPRRDDRGERGPAQRGSFARDRQRTDGGLDRPRGQRAGTGGAAGRPGGSARPFGGGGQGRPAARGSASEGRDFNSRSPRGSAPGGRPQGRPGDRQGQRPGDRGGAGGRGGFRPGAKRAAPAKRAPRKSPAPRPRREDEE